MNDVEVAWLAGLIEGEGSVSLHRGSSATLAVLMTDEDVIRKLRTISGVGRVTGPYRHSNLNARETWLWSVGRVAELRPLLAALLPYMGARRSARFAEATRHIASNRGARADLTCCPQGHPYEQRYKEGKARICKVCHRARNRRYHAAKMAARAAQEVTQ